MVKKGTYVEITKVVLNANERALNIPADTKSVPFEMRIKGVLTTDAKLNDVVTIQTETNRLVEGILKVVNPSFTHGFGHHVEILKEIRDIIKSETEEQ
jgi:2-amino-4-ketopentanoate thiolase alpha subunit